MRTAFQALGLGGILLGWNAPNHYPPWTTFHVELFAAVGLALIAVGVLIDPRKSSEAREAVVEQGIRRLAMPAAAWMWLLFASIPLLQHAAGQLPFRGDALVALLYGTGVAIGLYVGHLWAAQVGRTNVVRLLCVTVVIGALASAGLALVQWLRLTTPGWWAMELIDDRPFANFGQPNHLGLLMVMAIVAVTALYEMRAISARWTWALAVTFFGWGILMCQSRAAALAVLAVTTLWMIARRRVPTRLGWLDVLLGLTIGIALVAAIEPLQQAMHLAGSELRASAEVGSRQWIWLHFWAAILERPWTGYGFNQAVRALAEVAGEVHPSRNVMFAHNFVLDLMTWFGIPLAMLATFTLSCWMLGWAKRNADTGLMAQRHWVLAMWLALAVMSALEFPYAHSYFLLPLALLAGAVVRNPECTKSKSLSVRYSASRSALVVAAAGLALLTLVAWEYFRIETDYRANRFARANFASPVQHATLAKPMVLDQLGLLNASAGNIPRVGMSQADMQQLHALARRFHMLSTRLDYAKALELNGRHADAMRELEIIRSVYHPAYFLQVEEHWRQWRATTEAQHSLSFP